MKWEPPFRSTLPGVVWPAISSQNAMQKLALLFQIEQDQWRAGDEIAAAQFEQVRRIASFAAATVPHYQQQFGSDFSATDLDQKSWLAMPILSRKGLHDAGSALRSKRFPEQHGSTVELRTSGSTGLVVSVLGTGLTQLFWQTFCLRDHWWHRRDFAQKLIAIRYLRDPAGKERRGLHSPGWGQATDDTVITGPSIQFDILHDVAFLTERLVAEQPGYLLTHPSVMLGLARYCLSEGIRLPGLLEVRTLGESSSDALRKACHEAWGVPLVDIYSCQEAGYLALQCPHHKHLHVQSENVFLEVVDDAGQPCGPGQVGRVLVTSLNNFATPLIRYEIGDYAEVGSPCPCGRGLPVLQRVMGRYRNLLTLPDGSQRWPLMGYEGRLREIAPIELMQMVQLSQEEILVKLVAKRVLDDSEIRELTVFIQGNLGYPFRLRMEYVEDIRNPVNGKLEQFISLLEPKPFLNNASTMHDPEPTQQSP